MNLRFLQPADEEAFVKSLSLWPGEDLTWYSFIYRGQKDFSYEDMLLTLINEHKGLNLVPGRVPATMLYAFTPENNIIGRFHIRHSLNDYLLRRGGHIGYAVASAYRHQGVATEMMRQGLDYCKNELSLNKLLITCDDSNTGSWKLIEKFGGKLENKIWDEEDKTFVRRYWLSF